jgi:plasmid maintenance system antidote protein VapI
MARPAGHKLNRAAFEDMLKVRGLSITELHERTEIPRATISSLLGGFHAASIPTAHRLALGLDCQPQTLFPTLGSSVEAEKVTA